MNKPNCRTLDTPLMAAASQGESNIVRLLLDRRADASLRNRLGSSALHWASRNGHGGAVRLLLRALGPAAAAEVDARNSDGDTPLHEACRRGHRDTASALIKGGAHASLRNCAGQSSLDLAHAWGASALGRNQEGRNQATGLSALVALLMEHEKGPKKE